MTQKNRLVGGLIDRRKEISFSFDGKTMMGYQGDTLASALLANDVKLMGRSFKYHRPRGPLTSGSEEPNAIVELRDGARKEPNTRATTAELYDGLIAASQNRFPSLAFDFMAINDRFSNFLTAGFYYKTFMWPAAFWEKVYEPIIRRAAGLGSASLEPDPDHYDKGFLHCDLLVIGGGVAGLTAALIAGRSGVDVILADEDFIIGGRLNAEEFSLDDTAGAVWASNAMAELDNMANVKVMVRTTVIGGFDHGVYGMVERVADHLIAPSRDQPRQRLWRVYSKSAMLCAGATERSIAFENNDRPGIMLAGAMRGFANRWGAAVGRKIAIFTNNDDAHRTAKDLAAKGVEVTAVIDTRENAPKSQDFEVISNAVVSNSNGRLGVRSITVKTPNGVRTIGVDALGVSGGWNPNVHLTCHARGRPQWDDGILAFLPPSDLPQGMLVAGAANGKLTTTAALADAASTAQKLTQALGHKSVKFDVPKTADEAAEISAFWYVEGTERGWVDQQNDVTVKDITLAHQENFRSVEHLKRYTTLGMATDQGKTSNILGLAIMAELVGKSIPDTGTTIYRPPYTPTAIGVFAGRSRDKDFRPTRKTPSHIWAEEQGAVFIEVGMWLRAQWYPRDGETDWRQSVDREVNTTRGSVGICDVTTLGKIDVQGADAASFLNRIYCNGFAKLAVGKTRYGLMLREDGIAMDDGTAARLEDDHFVVTTTTANAVNVYRHMEFVRQVLWPDLDVQIISTTEAWAQYAVAGPNARKLLRKIIDAEYDLTNDGFPFMACANITVCGGLRARLFRISFSGELAYEIAVPTAYGDAMMRRLMAAGEEFGVCAYGTEALGVMRIEKGHAAGNELNGTTTAFNLGMGRMVSSAKDSIGAVLSRRVGLNNDDALKLVGVIPCDAKNPVPAGAHLMTKGTTIDAAHDQGYVTSACYSPSYGHDIG
ncbi:MAG: sarcosine oxidase subunit alpha family protein, partial [Candidatus Puniceispirillales bacterium WSBS_2018_MAG_OTU23]